jgi:hypothetical protein
MWEARHTHSQEGDTDVTDECFWLEPLMYPGRGAVNLPVGVCLFPWQGSKRAVRDAYSGIYRICAHFELSIYIRWMRHTEQMLHLRD